MVDARLGKPRIIVAYQRLARGYDVWGVLAESKARRRCLQLADIQNGEVVIEVAVGTGLGFVEILKTNPDGVSEGIDLTEAMLTRAHRKAERLGARHYALQVGDAYHLDYPDSHFDVLINNYMFDLLPERDFPGVLGEFRRVLRSGGRLVIASMTEPERWYQGCWELLYRFNPAMMGGCRAVRLLPYVESAGFRDTRREFVSQLTFPSEVLYGVKP